MKNLLCVLLCVVVFVGCTANYRAKHLGGNQTINLPTGTKLVTTTWKDSQLWYLYRPMLPGESAQTYTFHEKSNFGLLEGTVTFVESGESPRSRSGAKTEFVINTP